MELQKLGNEVGTERFNGTIPDSDKAAVLEDGWVLGNGREIGWEYTLYGVAVKILDWDQETQIKFPLDWLQTNHIALPTSHSEG